MDESTLREIFDWIKSHEVLLWWVTAGSVLVTVSTLVALPWVVASIPNDYFATKERPPIVGRSEHPVARWAFRIGKNLLGFSLVLLGLVLSLPLIPGQGLMTALAGLLLLEFPGKRRLELWLIRRGRLLRAINWLRARRGRPPLTVWTRETKALPSPSPTSPERVTSR